MPQLEIRLLGPFQVRLGGELVTEMRSDKVRALLAYLAVDGDQPHRREKLAGLLWPGYPEDSARASLRRALADLRTAIGDERPVSQYLEITRQTIQFERGSDAWVDVVAFSERVRSTPSVDEKVIGGWEESVALYRGELMEGFSLPDSPEYEQWLLQNREQVKRQALEALGRLVAYLEERGEYRRGLEYAWRGVELDPLRESAQRGLMRLLALSGQREAALAQYQVCERVLAAELGVEPAAETRQLYEGILKGEWQTAPTDGKVLTGRPRREIGACPYRGLAAFREQDAPFFFGRQDFTDRLFEIIQQPPVLAVILGPSGSGKSSIAHAGLLPRLRECQDWLITHLRPGARPHYSLAAALLPGLEPGISETDRLIESQKLASALEQGDITLRQILDRILEITLQERCLLLIDQFEELYTLCPEQDVRERFVDELLDVVEEGRGNQKSPCALLLTLRADFMGEALSYRPFADALQRGSMMLGPMTRQELRAAIEKPAEVQGAAFEAGLAERILEDVGGNPGNLPLLEFALTLLWERASSGWLTHEAYEGIGEVKGALARYAEQVFGELDEADRQKVQRAFLQLVRPGEGTEDTRRVAARHEIGDESWGLVQHLADRRLVVTGRDASGVETVEVVHEALIDNWERLKGWIDADRAFRTWQERLRSALSQWQVSGEDEGALLRGAPLIEARDWLTERTPDLSSAEIDFIRVSLDSQERRQIERERSRRRVIAGLTFGLVVTIILAIFAAWQWRSAQEAQTIAEEERDLTRSALSRSLASQAELLSNDELDLATLLSVEAVKIDPSLEARSSLLTVLTEQPELVSSLHGHQDALRSVAFSPDGRTYATGDASGGLYLREFPDPEGATLQQPRQLQGHTDSISSLAFSPDGRWLASGGFDDAIYLWDTAKGELVVAPLAAHRDNVWALAFSPDGETLVSGGADGQILFWDLHGSLTALGLPSLRVLATGLGIVSSLAISPDGEILAAGTGDGSVFLWDMRASRWIGELLSGHNRLVHSLAFSPDSQILASGGDDKLIVFWDVDRASAAFGAQIGAPLSGHEDWVTGLSFTETGDRLTSAGKDGQVFAWSAADLANLSRLLIPQMLFDAQGPVWSLVYSLDEGWLVSEGASGDAILWNLAQIHPLAHSTGNHPAYVSDLEFGPDGTVLASADDSGTIILQDPATGQLHLPAWVADPYGVAAMDINPDGDILATAGVNDQIRLWDVSPGSRTFGEELVAPLNFDIGDAVALAFHPDGKIMVSASADRLVRVWDTDRESPAFGELIDRLNLGNISTVRDLFFNQTGDRLVSISANQVRLWNMSGMQPGGIPIVELPVELRSFQDVLAITRSDILVMGTRNLIKLLNLNPASDVVGEVIAGPIAYSGDRIVSIDVSPDDRLLAIGDYSGYLQLWDFASLRPLGPALSGHTTIIGSLSFSPDGTSLASGDANGNLVLWNLDLDDWVAQACRRANRNLTQEEWRRYFGDEPYRATCAELAAETVP